MNIIDTFTNELFIEIISTSLTWKEIGNKLGYKSTISSNNKKKIIERCEDLGIDPPIIKKVIPVSILTKEQLFNSRKNWQSARSGIRKLALKSYENSGKELKCSICGYNKHVEIAHIKAVSDFEGDTLIEEINAPDNLIALCPNHHWEYDHGLLKL